MGESVRAVSDTQDTAAVVVVLCYNDGIRRLGEAAQAPNVYLPQTSLAVVERNSWEWLQQDNYNEKQEQKTHCVSGRKTNIFNSYMLIDYSTADV